MSEENKYDGWVTAFLTIGWVNVGTGLWVMWGWGPVLIWTGMASLLCAMIVLVGLREDLRRKRRGTD